MALTRMQANDVYRRYKEAVYWSEFAKLYEKNLGKNLTIRISS
jgi:hypothetical protein